MNIILIPGFWLNGESWDEVATVLRSAGHAVAPLTLPGLESLGADRAAITLHDHITAVVEAVDAVTEPVILVGHSGGGPIAWAAADARPGRVARVIFVDSGPQSAGSPINADLPVIDGEVPLPDWSVFDDADLIDLTDELRDRFRAIAIPEPAHVASDPFVLSDERRFDVSATVICCEFTSAQLTRWLAMGEFSELQKTKDYELVDLPTGHWPQFTRPADLAREILRAVERHA
jgi:pimeloyl-ACP methyl ester carboxylesterase